MYEMQFYFQDDKTKKREWKSIRPTNGKPYQYETKEKAQSMLNMCYPLEPSEYKRIIEV
jgi:hypothetical protein